MAILLNINVLRVAPNVSRSPLLHHCHTLACHSMLLPATPCSCQSLHAPICHSTLTSVTPTCLHIKPSARASPVSSRSLLLHHFHVPASHSTLPSVTPRSHLSLPPASPLSHLHAPRRYPRAHIEAQLKLGIAPWLQLDFVDIRHSGERPLGCFPVPTFESLFNRTERRSCECGSGAAE